ncbi:MAG: MmcQ/YjbR family DNA-binding protein [Bacteroidales bacterium]|nr:MmcQ/YjbR family DNA-binding protein [Bacteroidales bacterium]
MYYYQNTDSRHRSTSISSRPKKPPAQKNKEHQDTVKYRVMDLMDCREYILTFPLVEECQPFDEEIVVYKICGRWFATMIFSRPEYVAVKCNPDRAILLRDEYSAITPAWHFNKRHWNDLNVEMLPDEVVKRELRHSYFTVIQKNVTPKALREEVLSLASEHGLEDDAVLPE